jgi:dipeptidyl aminopeptidase/acylaminoacyl peptidase
MPQSLTRCVAILILAFGQHMASVLAQETQVDSATSETLNLRNTFAGKVSHDHVFPHWTPDGNAFWYRSDGPNSSWQYYWVDAAGGKSSLAFDHIKLAAALATKTGHPENPDLLPIVMIEIGKGGEVIEDVTGNHWAVNPNDSSIERLPSRADSITSLPVLAESHPSPDTGPLTSITFVNRTSDWITISRIDDRGVPKKKNGGIPPGELFEMPTHIGVVWLATDLHENQLGIYEAPENGGDAVIKPFSQTPTAATTAPATNPSDTSELQRSPDEKWAALVRDHNIYLRDLKTLQEYQVTRDGHEGDGYDSRILWSPDSSKLVALRTVDGKPEICYIVQSSPPDQIQPKLESFWYSKPGDQIPLTKPHLFDVVTHSEIPISDKLFPNPLPTGIRNVGWESGSRRFWFDYFERGCQVLRIIAVDATSGEATAILDEKSRTFLDVYNKFSVQYLLDTREFICTSERDGWNHLYLYDGATGHLKNQITRGKWVVRGLDWVDTEKRQVWFRAGGIVPGQDPYFIHYCRINFDGSGLVDLTPANGTHQVTYSPDRRFYIDTYSRVDLTPTIELRKTENQQFICELDRGDASALEKMGWRAPEPFVAKARDGVTDIYGVIYRPMTFDAKKKYPIIEDIYAGPQDSDVPKAFTVYTQEMSLAQTGFIVVEIDGMGTSNRSKAFHDVCWRNLGDAGLPDRILWIKAAAAKYSYMDLSRVGIYGYSAGGQNALRALEAFGDFYKVAVAVCGCHDNRLGDQWWTEQWMGWPVGPWYAEQSNVVNADKMNGKLLLIGCEMDHSVDPASTMQVVNALAKANKNFEMLVIPNAGHCEIGDYGERRLEDFFVKNLIGAKP